MPQRKIKGFTLIELLIAVAIMGILSVVGFALMNPAAKFAQARDAQRKSDLDLIRKTLEFYKSENGGKYPVTEDVYSSSGGFWIPGVDQNYIKKMPVDPQNPTSNCNPWESTTCFVYYYYSGTWCNLNGRSYILVARLESEKSAKYGQETFENADGSVCQVWPNPAVTGLYVLSNP